jgi:transposase
MLDQNTRTSILKLREKGHGTRKIARALGISRKAVCRVIESGNSDVPIIERRELAEPYREQILELHAACKGHLGRVHEELVKQGATLSYQALTGFCRRHGIGYEAPMPAGRYEFAPGEEMQHDTSPHWAKMKGVLVKVETASLVLCCSRMLYFQMYPRFRRFECKVFLTDALEYFGGAAGRCMIDNTHVVVLKGTGKTMVPGPEMAAFGQRFGFVFAAHEVGDANRSARVEGPFNWIENNFLNNRNFDDWEHLNREAAAWCDKANATHSSKLHGSRRELFAVEQARLRPLPIFVPEVYQLQHRFVDVEGYVRINRIRYSAPYQLIGRLLEVRELKDRVDVYDGPRLVATHRRVHGPLDIRVTDPAHRPERGSLKPVAGPPPEEIAILSREPRLTAYVAACKQHTGGRGVLVLRRLLGMLREYPREPFLTAVERAQQYGLYDLGRLERLVLEQIRRDYFVMDGLLPDGNDEDDNDDR